MEESWQSDDLEGEFGTDLLAPPSTKKGISNKLAIAEKALVAKLEESRSQYHPAPPPSSSLLASSSASSSSSQISSPTSHHSPKKNITKALGHEQKKTKFPSSGQASTNSVIPTDEIRDVLNLEIPRFDKNRTFPSLEKQKISKKDRHLAALDQFSKELESYSEQLEVEVLNLSRDIRDKLEKYDHDIQASCNLWKKDDYLVAMSSDDLDVARVNLKQIISNRENTIQHFAMELENIECQRASNVGNKIKILVDTLIGIAHQLPDEIEHIVENEAFDLNTVITKNRKSHIELLGLMKTKHIEIEVIALHEWDVAKAHWRHLRHQQALSIFHRDITSPTYTEPHDRQEFMKNIRYGQLKRHEIRNEALSELSKLNSENIAVALITTPQQTLQQVNEEELTATQDCYNGLSDLRIKLQKRAETRMEELRVELHSYGALCEEPPLLEISNQLKTAINSPELSELWRVGGGLKPDILSVANDFTSQIIFYEPFLRSVHDRLEILVCGFNLKEVLNERGRLPRLDIVRNLLSKSRTVPRNEVAAVLTTLLPDLKEMSQLEKMAKTFQKSLTQCIDGIEKELLRVQQEQESGGSSSAATLTGPGTVSLKGSTTNLKKTSTVAPAGESTSALKSTRKTAARTLKTSSLESDRSSSVVDPSLVKQWTRLLGILYYGCDIPQVYQQELLHALESTKQQKRCNDHVDIVVRDECDRELDRLDLRYKRLLDSIVTFLELQTSSLTYSCNQIVEFYLKAANLMEKHREQQHKLDETSLDALWDYKEDHRLACEERENNFQEACKTLQRSPDMNELQKNFEEVLHQLEVILESYRLYHGRACFLADQYPVSLADDFTAHMKNLCSLYKMEPINPHRILEEQDRLHELNRRLNKKYLEAPAAAAGEGEALESESSTEKGLQAKEYPEIFYIEEILPPKPEDEEENFEDETEPDPAPHRKYGLLVPFQHFIGNFLEENSPTSREEDEKAEEEDSDSPLKHVKSSESLDDDARRIPEKVNPTYPWLVIKLFPGQEEPPMVTLLGDEELQKMDADEIEVYEEGIAKYFVPQEEETLNQLQAAATAAAAAHDTGDDGDEKTKVDLLVAYERTLAIVDRVNQRKQEKTPKYLRENPPKDSKGASMVSKLDIAADSLSTMLQDLKVSLFSHLEGESARRIEEAEALTKKRKHELTEELEDLLRTHWPRSGLVETQIKRPREVELLNHEEKTYRFILSIQEKMATLQNKFEDEIHQSELCCEEYRQEIHQLTEQLSSVQFKTLASLQGVEVKARAVTQAFTSTGNNFLTKLRQLVAEEASSVMIYAKDFRKICPPQEEGKDGGYSPAELEEIGVLVEGQCKEIEELLVEWREAINRIDQLFSVTATEHGVFTNKYDQVANDLALSQGLGQKYGAPRRRAQEKLRTEMSRDDQCAGKVDELLAMLDFLCCEAVRKCDLKKSSPSLISAALQGGDLPSLKGGRELGYDELQAVDAMWDLAIKVRKSLYDRAVYLSVLANPSDPPPDIPWPQVLSHLPPSADSSSTSSSSFDNSMIPVNSPQGLHRIVDEVEKLCIQETKDLYSKEGKGELLKETPEGIPESLSIWLRDTRQKILGPKGHHEKSWKKLWSQIDSYEMIFGRKLGPMDQPQIKIALPAACFRLYCYGYQQYFSSNVDLLVEQFMKIFKLFEKCKEKHERHLRPRLGSPDALSELLALDSKEIERSTDLRENVKKFQSQIMKLLANYSKIYCDDLALCSAAFIRYLDTSLRLDLIQIPPDTEIPKKKMTLKRLRKAQRIQENVKNGGEDLSTERVWPALPLETILQGLSKAEPLLLLEDLQSIAAPAPPPPVEQPATTTPGKATKGKKKAPEPEQPPPVAQPTRPELCPSSWIQGNRDKSSIRGEVSTAHRLLINERDQALQGLSSHLMMLIDENKLYYGKILQQEDSWNARWRTQVEMLKQGNL